MEGSQAKRLQANPNDLASDADAYRRAALLLQDHKEHLPADVMARLAIEVHLKAFAQVHRGSFEKTHDLSVLFLDLPNETQLDIARQARGVLPGPLTKNEAREVVEVWFRLTKDNFARLRYFSAHMEANRQIKTLEPFPLLAAIGRVLDEHVHAHGLRRGRHVMYIPDTEELSDMIP